MRSSWIDNRIRYEFRSIIELLLHFSVSLIQLICVFAILGLQITLIITDTCGYDIGLGFWSISFLLLAPSSIWIVIWRRSSMACFIGIITHLIASLFATSIIIISFLVLTGQIGCSRMSLNIYYKSLHSSFIGIAGLFKIFNYYEIILLCKLKRNTDQIPTIFANGLYETDPSLLLNSTYTSTWDSWSTVSSEPHNDSNDLFV
jgi:hypothetical protein